MSWSLRLKPVHAVVGIIQAKLSDHLLVQQRPEGKPYSGYWEFPGGKIEENESAEAALKRELLEELGIHILQAQPCFSHAHHYPDKTVLLDIWLVTSFKGEPQAKEQQTLCWLNLAEIKKLRVLEGNLALMQKLNLYL
jgi:8-oxo-dGTP diphosphatase